jgi:transcriptional regulator with XRE-family HTH domain
VQYKNIRVVIGRNLRTARKAAGLTLEEAGHAVGRTKSAVLAWEAGESDVSAAQLSVLAAQYSRPIEWFFSNVEVCSVQQLLQRIARKAFTRGRVKGGLVA